MTTLLQDGLQAHMPAPPEKRLLINLHNDSADVYVPDGTPLDEALARTTHLGIGAHQDDLEFMALHGILACYGRKRRWFSGVICTSGSGSARTGPFSDHSDEQMRDVRVQEQRQAAELGKYSSILQLDHASGTIKDPSNRHLRDDIVAILQATDPQVIYTHNPADKHPTHIAVLVNVIRAMREMAPEKRPKQVLGCEVWRGLDWMLDGDKVALDCSPRERLSLQLSRVFQSQIAGGKQYDLAALGRRRANATYFDSHNVDTARQIAFAMDLTPLIMDPSRDIIDYVTSYISRFADNVRDNLRRQMGDAP